MTHPLITEATIRRLANPESFSRGEDYYRSGHVLSIEQRGNMLRAEVAGSSYEPYQVAIQLDESGIVTADCSCPYDWGGYCKHIVAVLLKYAREAEKIPARPTPEALLAGLGAETLRNLLANLLKSYPKLLPWVETQITLRAPSASSAAGTSPTTKPKRPPIDTNAVRRQVRYQMRNSGDYYATGTVVSGLDNILDQARQALEASDGENALAIASVIAEETIPGWEEFDDSDGEFGDWFSELGAVFTEALLTADLSAAERQAWIHKLEKWQAELEDYGIEDAFDAALCAATYGWDYAPLRKAMLNQDQMSEADVSDQAAEDEYDDDEWDDELEAEYDDEDEETWFVDELTEAWLNVLERQGRTEEFLNLARNRGQIQRYVTMLVKVGRIAEAVHYGLSGSLSPGDALAVAKALREHGEHRAALGVAERGLDLGGQDAYPLAVWLRDTAMAQGDRSLALKAARTAFAASISLTDYLAVQAVAGESWPILRKELLRQLREQKSGGIQGPVEVFLHEGLVDDAIKLVDRQGYADYGTLGRIADAAYASHPDWVIRQCLRQAEPIMDEGKSKYYHHALSWLEKARRAYLAAGRSDEWRTYCEGLISRHGRKHSLMPGLKALLKLS